MLSFTEADAAVATVEQRLKRTAAALDSVRIPYAVVGGHAVAVWVSSVDEGAVRHTNDVDILLRRGDLDEATTAMAAQGFERSRVGGITMFLDRDDPMPSRGVHVVFAGERVRPDYDHPAPDINEVHRTVEGVTAIGLRDLVVMKLQAYRRIDQVHLLDLLRVGLIDEELARSLPADLRPRLEELQANPDR